MQMFNSDKVVSVSAATLQGFDNNYAHYVNARCNRGDPACRPLFLRAPSCTATTKPAVARSGRRNVRGHGRSNLDRLAESQQLQQQLELAVQALMTKQQQEQQQQEDQQLQHANRFCPYCGHKGKIEFKFCPGCGSSLSSIEVA